MNCLSEGVIQSYIDEELLEIEMISIRDHISVCSSCKDLYNELTENKVMVLEMINLDDLGDVKIPPIPKFQKRTIHLNSESEKLRKTVSIRSLFVYTSSAAAILLLIMFLGKEKAVYDNDKLTMVVEEFYDQQDRNEMWQDGAAMIVFRDESGKVLNVIEND